MSRPFLWIVGGVVGLGLIVWMAFAIASEPTDTKYDDLTIGWGEVTVEGEFLPPLPESGQDPAVGTAAATISGSDWNGNSYSIAPDGRPKVVMFLAHWCPHCQAEVPELQAWVDAGLAPTDVDIYSITSLTNPTRTLWPPQEWLESEQWTFPVIMDDEISTAANAYGLSGTPFYVVLDGENNVVLRLSGRIGVFAFEQLVEAARASA
ncbi:MAG: TlpA disulfide reductase family protein [Acidimicrobiia bacterium]|nr:TlpA disulfide reductase family protein [Acidimicrobiia bacterium]